MKLQQEINFLQSALPVFESYLTQSRLFLPLSFRREEPVHSLTPGNLELALRVVSAGKYTAVPEWRQQTAEIIWQWKAHWIEKCCLEAEKRMEQWSEVIQQITELTPAEVQTNIRLRATIQALLETGVDMTKQTILLADIDARFYQNTILSDFIWEPDWQECFPQENWGFLYRRKESGCRIAYGKGR